ncbi:MAG: cyclic nucleotide-binding domain-containing protein [Betaproteobacteria bacterium]|nr:cyclic nucleotide-binding domain-containing protein [Betaproteobacteria bacterium]
MAQLEHLGDAVRYADRLLDFAPSCQLLENLSGTEVRLLARYLEIYRAQSGTEVVRQEAPDDFLLLVVEGEAILRDDGRESALASVGPGAVLGEMSLIDGAPRRASCIAQQPLLVAVLERESLARMIVEHPGLGAKLMMHLVIILARRVRGIGEHAGLIGML